MNPETEIAERWTENDQIDEDVAWLVARVRATRITVCDLLRSVPLGNADVREPLRRLRDFLQENNPNK